MAKFQTQEASPWLQNAVGFRKDAIAPRHVAQAKGDGISIDGATF